MNEAMDNLTISTTPASPIAEDPFNKEEQNAINSPSSVLGFSHNLVERIKKSKTLIDGYVKEMRDNADDAIRNQARVHEEEDEGISVLMNELKNVQSKRGLGGDDDDNGPSRNTRSGQDRDGSHSSRKDGLVQQRAKLDQELDLVDKELYRLHSEHKRLDKNVKGETRLDYHVIVVAFKLYIFSLIFKILFMHASSKYITVLVEYLLHHIIIIVVKEIEQREFTKAETVRREKEKIESSKKVTVDDLTLAVLKYEMLGVKFVKGDDLRLRIDFTQIDPNDPDDVYSFVLNLNDDEEYEVEDCEPFLNVRDIVRLVDDLNRTNEWTDFVVGMRNAFKAYIN